MNIIITATEFRSNQRKYFELAEKEPVFVTRAGKTPIALTPVDLDNYPYPTEKEKKAIKEGLEAYDKGDYTIIDNINPKKMKEFSIEIGVEIISKLQALKDSNQIELKESINTLSEEMENLRGLNDEKRIKTLKKVDEYYAPLLKSFYLQSK